MKTIRAHNLAVGVILGLVMLAGGAFGSSCDKSGSCQCAKPKVIAPAAVWESDNVCVYKKGEWVLKIEYLHKGSRSEGQNGTLFKGGKAVEDNLKGDTLKTSLGKLKHYGNERNVRWALTGWNFADRSQVKRSEQVTAKEATERTTKGAK